MRLSLRTGTLGKAICEYESPVVPRQGECIHLTELASASMLFRVVNVCYQAQNTDRESNLVDLEVEPADMAARQYIGEVLYQAS